MADGTDEDGAYAAKMDEWVAFYLFIYKFSQQMGVIPRGYVAESKQREQRKFMALHHPPQPRCAQVLGSRRTP
jgi:hypothetical protein